MAAPIQLNANLNLNPASINASAKQVQQALGRITGQASEFQKSLDASTARVFAFGATTAVIAGVGTAFKKLISTTITVQDELIKINAILGASAKDFGAFRDAVFNAAKATGQSFQTVAAGAGELARQGLNAAETSKRLEAAMILTRVSGLGAEQSVKALTAAINGFQSAGLTAVDVTNRLVAVDTRFAVSAQDLADGFSRAGSTAEDAGVSFNELLGLITAVEQKTARGGAVIGNAFKSIFTRLSRGKTIDQLQQLGVEIDASQSGVQKLEALSNALGKISDPTKASAIKELAGGVFQINVVSAALKDLSSETSIFAKATDAAANAGNDAFERNAELSKSLASQINLLVVSVTDFAEKVGSITFGPLLEDLISVASKALMF
jgi:TP901 family phage tail tape measure protein